MRKTAEAGFIQFVILFILVAGIIGGIYLVQHPTLFRPKASDDGTRMEFVDGNGNPITTTSSRNVKVKLTYVAGAVAPSTAPVSGCSLTDFQAAYGSNRGDAKFNANCDLYPVGAPDGNIGILDFSTFRVTRGPSSNPSPTPITVPQPSTSTSPSPSSSPSATPPVISQATITATPNPVPAGSGLGSTTINWDTKDGSVGEIWVTTDNLTGETFLVRGTGPTGSYDANWIMNGHSYTFRLSELVGTTRTYLNEVTVTRAGGGRLGDAGGGPKVAGIETAYAQSASFPTSFRIANSSGELAGAAEAQFNGNPSYQSNWTLTDGAGPKTVYAQFKVNGSWGNDVSASIEYTPPTVTLIPDKTTINSGDSIIFTWTITGGDMNSCQILGHTSNISDITTNNWNGQLIGNDDAGNNVLRSGTHHRTVTIGQQAAAQAPTYSLVCVSTNGTQVSSANVTITVNEAAAGGFR